MICIFLYYHDFNLILKASDHVKYKFMMVCTTSSMAPLISCMIPSAERTRSGCNVRMSVVKTGLSSTLTLHAEDI